MIFTKTKHGADKTARDLNRAGIRADAIHGNKTQSDRQYALNSFKSRKVRVLVATDIAARGIDIEELSHVINFDVPNVPESYVHRIGRTGRAGLGGVAITLCDRNELRFVRDIERMISKKITVVSNHPFSLDGNAASLDNSNPDAITKSVPALQRHLGPRSANADSTRNERRSGVPRPSGQGSQRQSGQRRDGQGSQVGRTGSPAGPRPTSRPVYPNGGRQDQSVYTGGNQPISAASARHISPAPAAGMPVVTVKQPESKAPRLSFLKRLGMHLGIGIGKKDPQ